MIEKIERRMLTDYNTISQSTVTEIARYREPPYPVHTVLQAALLLLGEDEQTTEVVNKREYNKFKWEVFAPVDKLIYVSNISQTDMVRGSKDAT